MISHFLLLALDEENNITAQSDWLEEHHPASATEAMTVFQTEHPAFKFRIERTGTVLPPKKKLVRFKVIEGQATYYSITVPEAEAGELHAKILAQHPDGIITRQEI